MFAYLAALPPRSGHTFIMYTRCGCCCAMVSPQVMRHMFGLVVALSGFGLSDMRRALCVLRHTPKVCIVLSAVDGCCCGAVALGQSCE